jgi:hypothetical protein
LKRACTKVIDTMKKMMAMVRTWSGISKSLLPAVPPPMSWLCAGHIFRKWTLEELKGFVA